MTNLREQISVGAVAGAVAGALLALAGCSNATMLKPTDSDALRVQVRDLKVQVEELTQANAQLELQVKAATQSTQAGSGVSAEAALATPKLVQIRVGSPSHYEKDAAGGRCLATLYLEPQDGLGRFLQVVGTLDVSIFELSATGSSRTLGSASFDPVEVRDAWRGGVLGSHYTFEVPIGGDGWNCTGSVTARLAFVDAQTGKTLSAQRELVEVRPRVEEASDGK